MFTGIIEDKGIVTGIEKDEKSMKIVIRSPKIVSDATLGDSIAVNGVCSNGDSFNKREMTVDVMPETVKATTIHQLKKGTMSIWKEQWQPADDLEAILFPDMWTE